MSKKNGLKHRARYTLEFKPETARLAKAGQDALVSALVLGVQGDAEQWVRLATKHEPKGARDGAVSDHQSSEPRCEKSWSTAQTQTFE